MMAQSAFAVASFTVPGAQTITLVGNAANGSGTYTALTSNIVVNGTAASDIPVGTIVFAAPSGWQFNTATATDVVFAGAGTAAGNAAVTYAADGSTMIVTVTGANTGAATITVGNVTKPQLRALTNTSASGNITYSSTSTSVLVGVTAGATVYPITAGAGLVGPYTLTLTPTGQTIPADGSVVLTVTAALRDAGANIVTNTAVVFSAGLGCYTSACTATSTIFTGAATGNAAASYRGKGTTGTDTIVATVSSLSAVGTMTVTLPTAATTGTTASTQSVTAVTNKAVAATTTSTGNQYVTPNVASDVTVRVVDGASNGVNGQVMLLSVDKGALAGGAGASCVGVTAKSITQTTATINTVAGRVQATYCAVSTEQGTATLTSQNISTTSVANVTTTLTSAGKPDKVETAVTGTNITATVKDANGVVVANGTPVRFTIASTVGVASNACVLTSDGTATSVIALTGATGSVIVSTDFAETGTAATCAAPGTVSKSFVVNLASGTVGGGTGTGTGTGGTGTISSGSVPASGGFGLIVFGGGTATQLVTASGCPAATAAFWATSAGAFVTYIPGTTIAAVNAAFLALFPSGNIPANTALVGKCV
jgi:hypothetical protein